MNGETASRKRMIPPADAYSLIRWAFVDRDAESANCARVEYKRTKSDQGRLGLMRMDALAGLCDSKTPGVSQTSGVLF
jgi:hypothetical protein